MCNSVIARHSLGVIIMIFEGKSGQLINNKTVAENEHS